VDSDYQYVRLILQNLLSNALKYSQPDSTISLALQHTSANGVDGVTISVSNAVGPIGAPEPSRIFSRYYRAEAARGQVGAGLGLWLSQQVAGQLGSKLHFEIHGGQLVFNFGLTIA
jgi:signal transduction histidine kinase